MISPVLLAEMMKIEKNLLHTSEQYFFRIGERPLILNAFESGHIGQRACVEGNRQEKQCE